MKSISVFCLVLLLIPVFSSCSLGNSIWRYYDLFTVDDVVKYERQPNKEQKPVPFDLDKDPLPGTELSSGVTIMPAYQAVLNADCVEQKRILRNRLQSHLMRLSDRICGQHKGAIYANAAGGNFALGTMTTLLSGAAAIVTGQTASNILSGSAAATNATRAQANESFYQNLMGAAILKAIDESRQEWANKIEARKADSISDYSVEDAVRDVQCYHQKCSFYEGVVNLTEAASRIGSSRDELAARIQVLRAQVAANKELKGKLDVNSGLQKVLDDTNERIIRQIKTLSDQLGVTP